MALTKAEQSELEQLRARAENAEKAAEELTSANDDLITANDEANVKIAEAAIEQQNAIDEAVDAAMLSRANQPGGKGRKSISPKTPSVFDRGAYFSTCHGDGNEAFAQNGWFYDNAGKPVRPVNK